MKGNWVMKGGEISTLPEVLQQIVGFTRNVYITSDTNFSISWFEEMKALKPYLQTNFRLVWVNATDK
jgi:hypothetical protein